MTAAVGMPPEMVEPMLDSPMTAEMGRLAHTVSFDGRVMLRGSMNGGPLPAEWADSVTVPTLVMDGGNSPAWLHNAARALVEVLPDVRYRTLEGQDHALPDHVQTLAPSVLTHRLLLAPDAAGDDRAAVVRDALDRVPAL